ncbi:MAG TPA: hypothetical protein VNT42_12470 [Sphingomonas sp.]|nr:hypothetical protein [Sphingomonas sp.]
MASTNETLQNQGDGLPTHFVVELKTEHGVRYAICERLMLATPGAESLPPAVIEEYLARHALRAAPIPTTGSGDGSDKAGMHWLSLAQAFQSGRAPALNVNIYNQPKA